MILAIPKPVPLLRAALLLAPACVPSIGMANAAGEDVLSIGIVDINPRSSSGPLTLTNVGDMPTNQRQIGSGVVVERATTALVGYEHFWTDQFSIKLMLGFPPTHKLQATGTLAAAGVLGDGQQLSPAVILKYNFGDAEQRLRPYIGLGINYTWFRGTRITNDVFRQASYGPASITEVTASSSWNPVYNLGLAYRLDAHWSLGLSLVHLPLKTRITVVARNTAIGVPETVVTDVRMSAISSELYLGYRF